MKTITTDPLWAWAIFERIRPIENRGSPTDYRGRMLVHGSQSDRLTEFVRQWIRRHTLYLPPDDQVIDLAYRGRLIGEVDLVDCVRPEDLPEIEREFASGPWCLRLQNPRSFVYPVPLVHCVDYSDIEIEPCQQ